MADVPLKSVVWGPNSRISPKFGPECFPTKTISIGPVFSMPNGRIRPTHNRNCRFNKSQRTTRGGARIVNPKARRAVKKTIVMEARDQRSGILALTHVE